MDAKNIYERKIKTQLTKWKTNIEKLKTQVEKAGAEAKSKYEEYLPTLHAKRDEAEKKLEELKSAGEATWESVTAGVEYAWSELSLATEHAIARFRQGMSAPNRDEEIRLIAYHIWEKEGRPQGRDREHWLRAEATWQDRQDQMKARPRSKTKSAVRRKTTAAKPAARETPPNNAGDSDAAK